MNNLPAIEQREPSLREILSACGIEASSDHARTVYHRRRACAALQAIEVTFIEPEVIELDSAS